MTANAKPNIVTLNTTDSANIKCQGNRNNTKEITVLFVDDEAHILSSLKRLFRKTFWDTHFAHSGKDALAILDSKKIDIVVSDMRMPGMSGAELLAAVNKRSPHIKQILMTGYSDMESTVCAINDANIYRYLPKPWEKDELVATINQAIYELKLERERDELAHKLEEKNSELLAVNTQLEERISVRTDKLERAVKTIKVSAEQSKDALVQTVKLLSTLIEQRGVKSRGRAARIAKIAKHLAEKLALDSDTQETIYFASLLLDIGKIVLPDNLLSKHFRDLTPQNQEIYSHHPENAEAMLMSIEPLKCASLILRQQCERFDGGGYPDKLKGNEIAIGAQIVGIASLYDRLCFGHLTEPGISSTQAIKQIKSKAGVSYPNDLVDLFVKEIKSDLFELSNPSERKIPTDDLEAGMTLSRDLVAENGVLLFSEGKALTENNISQINQYVRSKRFNLIAWIHVA